MSGAPDPRRRRRLVAGGLAAAALAAGAAVALWQTRRGAAEEGSAPMDLWQLSFSRLDGSTLHLSELRGKPLLINFWATWCAPCVSEMPLLDRFTASPAAAGWNVLALAVDKAGPVRRFIAEKKLRLPVALAGVEGIDLSRELGNRAGALPFTVVMAASGEVAERKLGTIDSRLLADWVSRVQ